MQFVYPAFLWALTAISIPIIIHLFHFRRYKKIVFSDIRFLKQLQDQSKSKQKLKDWLILFCRILTLSLLVFAFAQPFIPVGENSNQTGHKSISIFVDNSFSMNAEGSEGPLFEMAKSKARAIVNAYGNHDKFQVLTNSLSGSEQRYVNKSDALARIDMIAPAQASATADLISSKQLAGFGMQNNPANIAYWISDFQAQQFDLKRLKSDSNTKYSFIPVANSGGHNISVDSIFLTSPFIKLNEAIKFSIRLTNHGNEHAEGVVVTLRLNNVQKALLNVTIGAFESIITEATVTITDAGWQKGEVSISDYPITYDDKLYFSFKPSLQNNILFIGNEPDKYISAIFSDDASYNLTQNAFGNINYRDFDKYNLVILSQPAGLSTGLQTELGKYLSQGGQLLVIPPAGDARSLNSYALANAAPAYGNEVAQNLKVTELSQQSILFKGVFKRIASNTDLPVVTRYYPLQKQSSTRGRAIITLNNGDPLLWQTNTGKGVIYFLAAPLNTNYTNLPQHSLFVPVMLNMAMGAAKNQSLYYTIHQDNFIQLPGNINPQSKLISIKNTDQELVTEITQRNSQKLLQAEAINFAGWFDVKEQNNNQQLAVASFNSSRNESGMKFLSDDDIIAQTTALKHTSVNNNSASVLSAQISEELSGKTLWRWFVLLGLLFVLIEIALLKIK
jgi:hypothetical protein